MPSDELPEKIPEEGRKTIETRYGVLPPSIAIVAAIADAEGVDPTETDFILHDAVDPDALDRIFGGDRQVDVTEIRTVATFHVADYEVEIRNDGRITIDAPDR